MKVRKTDRDFDILEFKDTKGCLCNIQKSSIATEDCIWFGIDNKNQDSDTRMNLDRKTVKKILPHLQAFVESGNITQTKDVPRFTKDFDDVFIYDTKTGLEWIVGPDKDTTWDEAKSWTDSLTVDGGGWRMPTIAELRGLYQEGEGSRNMAPVFETTGWFVWSSETVGSSARIFYFSHGNVFSYDRNGSTATRVFGVRSGRHRPFDYLAIR